MLILIVVAYQLISFVLDLNLSVCDLHYRESVKFTYERDDGLVRSWIDHILCSQAISILVTDIYTLQSGVNLSDHLPLFFKLHINHSSLSSLPATSSSKPDWSEITSSHMLCDRLSDPPVELLSCSLPNRSAHAILLDDYSEHIMSTMLHCASYCFPCKRPSFKRVPGWKDSAGQLRRNSIFCHRVWEEAGCPSSGVLSTIKRQAKKRYKFEVRCIKRRRQYLIRDRLAHSFTKRKKDSFWLDVKSIKSNAPHFSPVVDGANGDTNIANAFASKFSAMLNKHSTSSSQTIPSATIQSSLTESHLSTITVSYDQITEAISLLKSGKSDAFGVTSEHLKYASPVIANVLSSFFTAILWHGYMPLCFRDSVLVPILKGNKDATDSSNYHPIALSSTFSKIVERLILSRYESVFATSSLQFGFKPDSSTSLCSAAIKNIIARYIDNGSPVLGCFLDASKAFDLVDHDILYEALMKRGLPLAIIRFLLSWYKTQSMRVGWKSFLSEPFCVSNGVRQGSVFSFLFAVYLDGLLVELSKSGVGCHWGSNFAGDFSYADDVLLAPCASALRTMLNICSSFAVPISLNLI